MSATAFYGLMAFIAVCAALERYLDWRDKEAAKAEEDADDDLVVTFDVPHAKQEPAPAPETTGTLLDYLEHGGTMGMETAVGRASDHARGILYQGPWTHPADGFQTHTRRCARALARAGVPVHLRALTPVMAATAEGSEEERVEKEVWDLIHASISAYSVLVHQVVPTQQLLDRITMPSALGAQIYTPEQWSAQLKNRVLYVVYERTPIPSNDLRALGRVGQVWVACERDAESLRQGGVEESKIRVVPVPYASDDPLIGLRSRERDAGPPRFYHIGKWEPRKAADRILGAFLRAFKPGEAELYLKTSLLDCSFDGWSATPEVAVATRLKDPKVRANGWTDENVFEWVNVQTDILPATELRKIHEWGDVYVTLSRGEGFDMPAFDAKLSGNLMVYTPSGGPQDFAEGSDILVEPTGLVPTHAFYNWGAEARWLDFDLNVAVEAFQKARATILSTRGTVPSWSGPVESTKLASFSSEAVGQRMRDALQDLVGPEGNLGDKP